MLSSFNAPLLADIATNNQKKKKKKKQKKEGAQNKNKNRFLPSLPSFLPSPSFLQL